METNVKNTIEECRDDIDNALKPISKKVSKKRLKAMKSVLNERLKRNETRIRLREKVAKKREDNIIEMSKDW
jgi:hypothetical protein